MPFKVPCNFEVKTKEQEMTTIHLTDGIIKDEILVVGLSHKKGKNAFSIESGDIALDAKKFLPLLADLGATGKADEVIKVPGTATRLLVFTGLGEHKAKFEDETLRRAAGAAARELAGSSSATFSLPTNKVSSVAAVAEGALLGAYVFNKFRVDSLSDRRPSLKSVTVHSPLAQDSKAKAAVKRAAIIGDHVTIVRDLINTPPSHLTPDSFCKVFSDLVKKAGGANAGLKVSIANESQLKSKGYGGITSVGQGSANPPRLLHISYRPAKVKALKTFAYVGKGITFDTGGLALKPAAGMEAMKSDMSGAAAVCAATIAIALLKLPIAIDCYAPLAENMVSDHATRPSDIITMYGGKTIEVINPDAEGRLVLADGLAYADAELKPDYLIDVATLTGAATLGLGRQYAAMYTRDVKLAARLYEIGNASGDHVWHMPLVDDYKEALRSDIADFNHIARKAKYSGGSVTAALFLEHFAGNRRWVHLDIAGTARSENDSGENPKGGTGYGVRLLTQWIMNLK